MKVVVLIALLTGCAAVFDLEEVHFDPGAAAACYGLYGQGRTGLLEVCLDAPPEEPLELPALVDTTDCARTLTQGNAIEVCVLAGTTVSASFGVRVIGTRPLVLVALTTVVIGTDGVIDVAGRRTAATPAGANVAACSALSQNAANVGSGSGAGGGAGGALSASGGDGGTGSTAETPAAGGRTLGAVALDGIRGGCRGGRGGNTNYATGGAGGSSGGALYVIAGESIAVRGVLNASGAGGDGGEFPGGGNPGGGGGGGGGSGGLIALDAPSIELTGAHLVACGGGGGGGGGTGSATAGVSGSEPDALGGQPLFAAKGGPGGLPGGSSGGRAGDASDDAGLGGSNATAGAGGGGGSTGHIRFYSAGAPVIDATSYVVPAT